MNKIITGKASVILQDFDSECIDLVITSPPYDNLRDYEGFEMDFPHLAYQLYRILKDGGVLVWVVGDATIKGSETCTSFKQAIHFKDVEGFRLHDTMIYEKAGSSFPSKVRYTNTFEYMFILSKGKPKTINLLQDKPNRWAGHSTFGNSSNRQKDGSIKSFGKRVIKEFGTRTNIWRYANGFGFGQTHRRAYEHPATFPEKLAEDHIVTWSNEGDIVLDPMCGSGTTLRSAKKLNRQYVGIDISETYCNLARDLL